MKNLLTKKTRDFNYINLYMKRKKKGLTKNNAGFKLASVLCGGRLKEIEKRRLRKRFVFIRNKGGTV